MKDSGHRDMGYFIDKVSDEGRGGGWRMGGFTDGAAPSPKPDTAESRGELLVDKSQLIGQVSGVLNSVGVALARLMASGKANPGAMAQLEQVQSQAQHVLSALESGGVNQLAALAGMTAAISGDLSYDTDSTASAEANNDNAPLKQVPAMTPQQMNEKAAVDPLMTALDVRSIALDNIRASHAALEAHAVSSAEDAKMDMDATVALASMRYSGKSPEEVDAFLANAKEQMLERTRNLAAYQGAPEELIEKNVNERFALIQEQAQRIETSMHIGGNETARSLASAAEEIVDLHARHLKAHSLSHFNTMDAQLSDYMDADFLAASKQRAGEMDQARHDMHHALKDKLAAKQVGGAAADGAAVQGDPQAYLQGLMQSNGISDVFDEGITEGTKHAGRLHSARHILADAYEKTMDDRALVYKTLYGKTGNIDKVAGMLRMDKADVIKDVASFQENNGVALPASGELKREIAEINAAMKGRAQGASVGMGNFG